MPVRWRAHGQLWRSRGVLALAEPQTGSATMLEARNANTT